MAKQKKIMDINEGGTHLVVIKDYTPKAYNPFRIYLIISATGAPLRKRILIRYGDFMSCIYFLRDFYLDGVNAMCYTDMVRWVRLGFGEDA